MASPFYFNKKERKSHRKRAKANAIAADKLAEKGLDPQLVETVRRVADSNTRFSLMKRRKNKPKNPRSKVLILVLCPRNSFATHNATTRVPTDS